MGNKVKEDVSARMGLDLSHPNMWNEDVDRGISELFEYMYLLASIGVVGETWSW